MDRVVGRGHLEANLQRILAAPIEGQGFDVLIVSTTDEHLARWWQHRLDAARGQVIGSFCEVVVVVEDWPGGAGNGLGTLFAVEKASAALRRAGRDRVVDLLDAGAAVAIYHTAGKGTRLAPLPGVEGNDKSRVKLPGAITIDGSVVPLTLLEAVLLQTGVYAESRPGRLSVFWGDQIFLPSASTRTAPAHHVDLLARRLPFPDEASWSEQGLHRYGLLAIDEAGEATQLEKMAWRTVRSLVDRGALSVAGGVGVSLGSFSISAVMCRALLDVFESEVRNRRGRLDTDPHFWMPLGLDADTYSSLMAGKGFEASWAHAHHERMQQVRAQLVGELGLLGAVDVGAEARWWDYGQLRTWADNQRTLLADDDQGALMRRFFGVTLQGGSAVVACELGQATLSGSVLVGVRARRVDAMDSLLFDVEAPTVEARRGVAYHASHHSAVVVGPGEFRADAILPDGRHLVLRTTLERDGGEDWETRLPGNPVSWSELHALQREGQ